MLTRTNFHSVWRECTCMKRGEGDQCAAVHRWPSQRSSGSRSPSRRCTAYDLSTSSFAVWNPTFPRPVDISETSSSQIVGRYCPSSTRTLELYTTASSCVIIMLNPLDSKDHYSATSNNTKLVYWPLTGGLLHLVQRWGTWADCGSAQAPHRCTKCNSSSINSQFTNHCIALRF